MFNFKQYNLKKLNITLIVVALILAITGVVLIKIVEPDLFKKQLVGVLLGLIICAFLTFFDYHALCGYAVILYGVAIVLLIMVQIPGLGMEVYGATRWIDFKVITIQPTEICKVVMIIVLAQFLTMFNESINNIKTLALYFMVFMFPLVLILIQPDLSSSLVLVFFFLIMLYSAEISYRIIVPSILIGIPTMIVFIWYVCQPYQAILHPYQQERILGLLYPEKFPDKMFQQNKSVKIVGNGKLYGILNGGSTDDLACKKLPIVESDFIFASVGEILGFLGSTVVIILLMILVFKCLSTAKKAKDFTGRMICIGVSAMFMFQVFANIGVVVRILPNTGLPLPFISYGLTALLSYFSAIGIVLNIGLQGKNTSRG